jgi:hypothetical protein
MSQIVVRDSTDADMPAVQRIYAHHVLQGLGSFEETPPSVVELQRRRARAGLALSCSRNRRDGGRLQLRHSLSEPLRLSVYAGGFRLR